MRFLRVFPVLSGMVACIALAAANAHAASVQYDLVSGSLTAVTVGDTDLTNRLAAPVAIDTATVVADFDPSVLDLENLFISATGPGTVSLTGINGWDSVVFSNASLQSIGISDITGSAGSFNFGTPVTLTSDLNLTDASGFTVSVPGYSATSAAFGTIGVTSDGLQISLRGVVLGYLPDPLSSTAPAQAVKADFDFVARTANGSTAIPEPGSQLLFPAGLALLGWVLRLKKGEVQ